MAGKTVFKLKVTELKRELEERDLETHGNKNALQARLIEALEKEGQNPETFTFEEDDIVKALKEEIIQNSRSLKEKIFRSLEENSRSLKEEIIENSRILEDKMTEKFQSNLEEVKQQVDKNLEQFKELEERMTQLEAANGRTGRDSDANQPSVPLKKTSLDLKNETDMNHKPKLNAPVFDGKSASWDSYLRQFEAAAKAYQWTPSEKVLALILALRGEALDVLQAMPLEDQDNFDKVTSYFETRYGSTHLRQVHHIELKNRTQKAGESLQEFEMVIARLARKAYPSLPDGVLEELAREAFVDGLRDVETKQALRLSKSRTLVDSLAQALEFEAVKRASKNESRVREVNVEHEDGPESVDNIVKLVLEKLKDKKSRPRCWNCGEIGHLRSRCGKPQKAQPAEN